MFARVAAASIDDRTGGASCPWRSPNVVDIWGWSCLVRVLLRRESMRWGPLPLREGKAMLLCSRNPTPWGPVPWSVLPALR